MKTKYLKNSSVSNWLRLTKFDVNGVSIVWNSFLKVLHWLKKGISWYISNGKSVITRIDPFVGDKEIFFYA